VNPVYIIGISALYHDSAACLLKDGMIVFAAKEERFSRVKHDSRLPVNAVNACLEHASISMEEVSYISYYEKPILKFDRILMNYFNVAPKGFLSFRKAMNSWLKSKLWTASKIKKELKFKGELLFVKHHESHSASSVYTSGFSNAAFLSIDGVGENETATYGVFKEGKMEVLETQNYPHSIGLLYSAFTLYCGFKVNSGEYKLMGLAPYGKPIYTDLIKTHFVEIEESGAIRLDMKYFDFMHGLQMINTKFEAVLGQSRRQPESEMSQFYKDVAASIQEVTEEILLKTIQYVKEETGESNLCLSGGVALNCVANAKLRDANIFDKIWIQPASGDSGGALGAAYLAWYDHLGHDYNPKKMSLDEICYLGKSYDKIQIEEVLKKWECHYKVEKENLVNIITNHLMDKKVVGWFQGRMEFGPRALGNRSILAGAQFEGMKTHVNLKIKKREGFRPFAPIVLAEFSQDWFEGEVDQYMCYVNKAKNREKIPSCVHEDHTARAQSVSKKTNQKFHQLLTAYHKKSGIPVLINTSFNERGEPIVASPEDALECFFNTDMDILVLGDFILSKEANSHVTINKKTYALD
jgi:carbamoyltransferase